MAIIYKIALIINKSNSIKKREKKIYKGLDTMGARPDPNINMKTKTKSSILKQQE
jgi:hypothetical protein